MKIKINNYEFTIKEVEPDSDSLYMERNDAYHWGICNYIENSISIRKDLDLKRKRAVLLHELSHAFIEAYGFYQTEKTEEVICDIMCNYMDEIVAIADKYFKGRVK